MLDKDRNNQNSENVRKRRGVIEKAEFWVRRVMEKK